MTPCINLYPTTACDAKKDNRKQNTIASYAMKKFGIEYQGFLLRFCTHRNYFNFVFRSTKLRKYAIRSLIWSYDIDVLKSTLVIQPWNVNCWINVDFSLNRKIAWGRKTKQKKNPSSRLFSGCRAWTPLTKTPGSAHAVNAHLCTKAIVNAPFFVFRDP